jgi:glycosyltransferase involved in cell wall biosynthesis
MVVLEAMALGIPVVCLEKGGPGQFVTEQTGVVVPVRSYEQTVTDLSNGILLLASNPELRAELGRAARVRARTKFLWPERSQLIACWYTGAILSRNRNSLLSATAPQGPQV